MERDQPEKLSGNIQLWCMPKVSAAFFSPRIVSGPPCSPHIVATVHSLRRHRSAVACSAGWLAESFPFVDCSAVCETYSDVGKLAMAPKRWYSELEGQLAGVMLLSILFPVSFLRMQKCEIEQWLMLLCAVDSFHIYFFAAIWSM